MTILSDRQVPLAVWVAQPAKKNKNVGSGLTVGPDASGVLALKNLYPVRGATSRP